MFAISNEDIMILQNINEELVILFEVVSGGECELENVPSACEEYEKSANQKPARRINRRQHTEIDNLTRSAQIGLDQVLSPGLVGNACLTLP